MLWVSPWTDPQRLTAAIHPSHTASAVGFRVHEGWANTFWGQLADRDLGVRVQIHTHPGVAYHSATDDAFPFVTMPGFLSLVIPRFAQGVIGFDDAYLTELQSNGSWRQVPISESLELV